MIFFALTLRSVFTGIAQLAEQRSPKPQVGSSSLSSRAYFGIESIR